MLVGLLLRLGQFLKYLKARLGSKGHTHVYDLQYGDIFSHMAQITTV